jgi:hypothetical protein
MPGIGLVIDGAMQQAPHRGRQAGAGMRVEDVADDMAGLSAQCQRRWRDAAGPPKIGDSPHSVSAWRVLSRGRRSGFPSRSGRDGSGHAQ